MTSSSPSLSRCRGGSGSRAGAPPLAPEAGTLLRGATRAEARRAREPSVCFSSALQHFSRKGWLYKYARQLMSIKAGKRRTLGEGGSELSVREAGCCNAAWALPCPVVLIRCPAAGPFIS
ncbi:hypothetical protein NDU88_001203 [Pleurodeles waltl]|uniref:Uncharacterized protein n=1 Tax=Pleurodeles waltl TaxID=8319 RepID=A0AAV7US53_PLEWA|nr:hypothetical protein NDU88_001203 [Pleurodeles waltl]